MNLIEDYNELNKIVQYDIDKEKDICQKSGNFSDDSKVNKNVTTDKDKTDLNNSNDIIGTSYKHKSSKDDMRRKKDNPVKKKIFILFIIFRYFGDELKSLLINNSNRVIIGQININSIKSKFVDLVKGVPVKGVRGNIDILMISETKLDASFPISQFYINGYTSPYRLDRNGKGGGILVHVREDIPSKLISQFPNVEGFFLEINLRKKK